MEGFSLQNVKQEADLTVGFSGEEVVLDGSFSLEGAYCHEGQGADCHEGEGAAVDTDLRTPEEGLILPAGMAQHERVITETIKSETESNSYVDVVVSDGIAVPLLSRHLTDEFRPHDDVESNELVISLGETAAGEEVMLEECSGGEVPGVEEDMEGVDRKEGLLPQIRPPGFTIVGDTLSGVDAIVYQCISCNYRCQTFDKMDAHIKTHAANGDNPHKCSTCDAVFPTAAELETHSAAHTLKRNFICAVCGMTFANKHTLTDHMPVHTGEENYQCPVCAETFHRRITMLRHTKIHIKTEKKPFECLECCSYFSKYSELNRHRTAKGHSVDLIGSDEPVVIMPRHSCRVCNAEFNDEESLKLHLNSHLNQSPHRCDICGRCFVVASHLTTHMKTHSSERPYKCDQCGVAFKLYHHLQNHSKVHTNERSFVCAVCAKSFKLVGHLTTHMTTHSAARPHQCTECESTFKLASHLKQHMTKVHQALSLSDIL